MKSTCLRSKIFLSSALFSLVLSTHVSNAQDYDYSPVSGTASASSMAGYYAGAFVGGGMTSESFTGFVNGTSDGDEYNLGLYAGALAQSGNMLFGGELELSTSIGENSINNIDLNLQSTMAGRARVGLLANDRTMLYGSFGLASSAVEISGNGSNLTQDVDIVGYQLGAGAEFMISNQMYLRGEYMYTNYFDEMLPSSIVSNSEYDLVTHQIRVGLGYRF